MSLEVSVCCADSVVYKIEFIGEKMRFLLYIASVYMMIGMPAQALTLECKTTKYGNTRYDKKIIDSWLPKTQVHVVNLKNNTVVYKASGLKGKVVYFDSGRIRWEYYSSSTTVTKYKQTNILYKFIFFPKTKLLVSGVWFTSLLYPIEGVSSRCVVTKITKAEQELLNKTPDTQQGADRSRVEGQF
jgi:hypothetical protein